MSHDTLQLSGESDSGFVQAAVRHELLSEEDAEKILAHAQREGVCASDAALSLSLLAAHQVDAVALLSEPAGLAPGFELTGLLGNGASGIVFRARQTSLQREVALKTLITAARAPSTGQARLQREAKAIARLQHPHIVSIHDSGFFGGRYCIAMELVEGETLSALIKRRTRLTEKVTWQIARQAASALAHAEASEIIHRDIKPGNILLTKAPAGSGFSEDTPFVKVVDFGLAFSTGPAEASQITATGTTLGTPAYVAPEQLHDTHVDARADIYSLGATVFHMLTGHAPFSGRSPMRVILGKTTGDDSWRDQLPTGMLAGTCELFRQMTESDPDQRLDSYAELVQRIDEILGQGDAPARAPKSEEIPALPDARSPSDLQSLPDVSSQTVASVQSMPQEDDAATAPRWRWLTPVITLCLVCLLIPILLQSGVVGSAPRMQHEWTATGFPQPLFNGLTVPIEFQESGTWLPTSAPDGSRVLSGGSGGRLLLPMRVDGSENPNVRMRVGINFPSTGQLTVSSVFSDTGAEIPLLQLSPSEAVSLDGLQRSDSVTSDTIALGPSLSDSVVFHRLVFSRQDGQIIVRVNGTVLGAAHFDAREATKLRFHCTGGSVNLADLDLVELTPELGPASVSVSSSNRDNR